MLQSIKKQIIKTASIVTNDQASKDLVALINSQHAIYAVKLELGSNEIGPQEIKQLSQGKWKSLCKIDLFQNRLGNKGCQFLTRAQLSKLNEVRLSQNQIGTEGVLHLSKSCWKKLDTIYLASNNIGINGTKWLVRGNWRLKHINLNWNQLQGEEMLGLLLSEWKKLSYLTLGSGIVNGRMREKVRQLIRLKCESVSIYF